MQVCRLAKAEWSNRYSPEYLLRVLHVDTIRRNAAIIQTVVVFNCLNCYYSYINLIEASLDTSTSPPFSNPNSLASHSIIELF